ncbi:hypothetical protein DRW07_07445 [Alteromonas sediminis]|uniref:Solute-binding protein family 3/N-terminal domain-containing protein n=2 Tax=Alteromonas sediminis TaxID=2259342 RepID=A0A3N5Y1T7_9ALTE|nr:hypothetical protein DRW07_07445 [Alteromonas sediminis]
MFIRDDVLENYTKFVGDSDVLQIDNFESEFIRRDVVEMVLVQQALKLGGLNINFVYAPGRVNFRNTRLLEQGKLLLSFDSYWRSDAQTIADSVYMSEPVIRAGEYHAGIFASPEHPTIFTLKTLSDLEQYSAVSTPRWKTDWHTLSALPLKELIREDEWVSQANMVSKMYIDFIIMPFFANDNDIYELETIRLRHVPNVAILLNDSRHYVISKKHPLGAQAYQAINKGLAILRRDNRIVRAYRQAGFFIDTEQYTILNQ